MAAKTKKENNYLQELVPYKAFRGDDTKHRDDIFVSVNEKTYRIKRGVTVMIPRAVKMVLDRAEEQRNYAMNMEDSLQEDYRRQTRGLGY